MNTNQPGQPARRSCSSNDVPFIQQNHADWQPIIGFVNQRSLSYATPMHIKTGSGRNRAEQTKIPSNTGPGGTQRIRGPPRSQGFAADRANGLCDMIGRLAPAGAYSAHGAGPPGWVPNGSDQSDPPTYEVGRRPISRFSFIAPPCGPGSVLGACLCCEPWRKSLRL
jgi:hypothetical protein